MKKVELSDIRSYKTLFVFIVIVAGLYNLGFWSTFKINILSYYDITGLVSSFIFPFLFSIGIILLGLLFSDFFSLQFYNDLPFGGNKDQNSRKLKITKLLFYLISTAIFILIIYLTGIEAWLICSLFGWGVYSVLIINILLKNEIIEHEKTIIKIVQLSILVVVLSFSVGKYNGLKIKKNIEFDYMVLSHQVGINRIQKYLGKAGNHYFLTPIDNSKKIIIKDQNLELHHYNSNQLNNKFDSLIYNYNNSIEEKLAITTNIGHLADSAKYEDDSN